jgi:hypothetical protein
MEHVVALEPSLAGRRDPEPWGTWQPQSPPRLGGRVRCCRTRGSAGAHLSREVRSGAIGHLTARGALPSREAGSRAMGHVAHQSPPL